MQLKISAACMALLLMAGTAEAATQNTQQSRMESCNKQASGKSSDERATFMKHCLASAKSGGTRHHKTTSGKTTHAHRKSTASAKTHHVAVTSTPAASTPTEQ